MNPLWFDAGSWRRRLVAALLLGVVACGRAATFVVTNVNDTGAGSLRQALTDANARAGADVIEFNITSGTPPFVINLASALPVINEAVVIEGTTQPGFNNKPVVVLNGAALPTANGLTLAAGGTTVRGLVLQNFAKFGIEALASTAGTNVIQGCFIGTDANGMIAQTNLWGGIHIGAAPANLIGGTNAGAGNVISGNANDGLWIETSTQNTVVGNWIGCSWGGINSLGNVRQGIRITGGQSNTVGGTTSGARNIISGNGENGVTIEGVGALNNVVQGNYIGLDGTGATARGNGQYGVRLLSGARFNQVGGTNAGEGNTISGNLKSGVDLSNGARENSIQGNYIGTSKWGTNAVANGELGVALSAATNNLIGGTVAGARNLIAGNTSDGIAIYDSGAISNRIEGNYIGVDGSGTNRLGNGKAGVWITNASANSVGSAVAGGGNVIAGNGTHGVYLQSAGANGNRIQGNLIGLDATGVQGLGNGGGYYGVAVERAPGNVIGGILAGARNIISSNNTGIYLSGTGASNNLIQGNYIGTDLSGMNAMGNQRDGIVIGNASTPAEIPVSNVIGGAVAGAGNVIAGHGAAPSYRSGIYIGNSVGTVVQGNLIGVKADGVSPLPNNAHNVELELATNTLIGGSSPAAGNVIANVVDPARSGIRIRSGFGNFIQGNSIYANGLLGICFSGTLVTANDGCDTDSGANGKQNFPTITNAVSDGWATSVKGLLGSAGGQTYLLQFYASPVADASGYGEGQMYLGAGLVTLTDCTNGFAINLPKGAPAGWMITGTATDAASNTSEFSLSVPIGGAPALEIQPAGAQQIGLGWLVTNGNGGAWQLAQATNLNPPVTWAAVTNTPTVASNGTWFTVTLPATNSTRYFRLLYP